MRQGVAVSKKVSRVENTGQHFVPGNIRDQPDLHQDTDYCQKQEQGGQETKNAASVEHFQTYSPRPHLFGHQQAGDEVAAKHEKQEDAECAELLAESSPEDG